MEETIGAKRTARDTTTERPSAPRDRAGFRPDIEGLRAVAVALVVANHVTGIPRGGFIGVDVFFVISGYLITGLLVRERDRTGHISLRSFYVRRARRILPMALLVNAVTCAAGFAVFLPGRALQIAWDGIASALMIQNWHLIRTSTGYFDGDGSTSPLQHYWSLAVEEQFYVFWAAAVVVILSVKTHAVGRRRLLLVVTLIGTTSSLAVACWETADRAGWTYFSLESRAWELGVGALVALGSARFSRLGPRTGTTLVTVGLTMLGVSAAALSGASAFPGPWALLPTAGAACILISGSGGRVMGDRVLTNPVSRHVGRISFSLYLWHLPLWVTIHACVPTSRFAAPLISIAASVGLSALTYRFVEVPFLTRRHRKHVDMEARTRSRSVSLTRPRREDAPPRHPGRWTAFGVVALLALTLLQLKGPGWVVGPPAPKADPAAATPGAPFSGQAALTAAIEEASAATTWPKLSPGPGSVSSADAAAFALQHSGCLVDPLGASTALLSAAARRCTFSTARSPDKTIVVFGDSIATSWIPALVDGLLPRGWRVVGMGLESCPAADVSVRDRVDRHGFTAACNRARSEAIARILDLDPDVVLMSSALGDFERTVTSTGGTATAQGIAETWRNGTRHTSDLLARNGRTRVIVAESPPESVAPADCAVRPMGPSTCLGGRSAAWLAKAKAEKMAARAPSATSGRTAFLSTEAWFCTDDGRCPAFIGTTLVKADTGHLTTVYSRRLSTLMARAVLGYSATGPLDGG